MLSMTGYGKAEYSENGIELSVEIKTVNNRIFDFNLRAPRTFVCIEDGIRKTVQKYVGRARIDVFVNFSDKRELESADEINYDRAIAFYKQGQILAEKLGIENDLSVSKLFRMPDVFEQKASTDMADMESIVYAVVEEACKNLNKMRKVEGEKLIADMFSRIENIRAFRDEIIKRAPQVVEEYKAKLKDRITDALKEVPFDEAKLLNEVAFFTDKVNIDEELTRLGSHINQFCEIAKTEGSGKKLDFLMQEFNREANTICSKSNDLTVTRLGLSIKNEIEKIREQVQNVE